MSSVWIARVMFESFSFAKTRRSTCTRRAIRGDSAHRVGLQSVFARGVPATRPKHIAIRAMLWDGGYGKTLLLECRLMVSGGDLLDLHLGRLSVQHILLRLHVVGPCDHKWQGC